MRDVEDHTLIVLLVAVSLAFAWILWPFSSAILWATVLAIVFAPLYRRLLASMGGRQNFAAIATVLIIVTMVIIPLTFTAGSLLQEATNLYETIEAGQTDFGQFIQQVINALPTWATDLLNRLGLTDLGEMQRRLSAALVQGSKTIATQALSIGKGTANFVVSLFVMLYLPSSFCVTGRRWRSASRTRFRFLPSRSARSSPSSPSSSAPCSRARCWWPPCKARLAA